MKISDIGEFALIERIKPFINQPKDGVVVDVGDDAAVIEGTGRPVILTTDVLVDGVHFNEKYSAAAIGYKALAVNISDIAAMGGRPRFALISLGLSMNTDLSFIDELYLGLTECAAKYDVGVIGGNISRSGTMFISVTLTGETSEERILRRGGAKVGDMVMVTGALGASAIGLMVINSKKVFEKKTVAEYGRLHFYPPVRVREGRILVETGCTAAEDISDSFLMDLSHLCEEAGVGSTIKLDDIPVAAEVNALASKLGVDPLEMALTGGEDYELLFTVSPGNEIKVTEAMREIGTEVTVVGRITPGGEITVLDSEGKKYRPVGDGYDHFLSKGETTSGE